MFMRVTRSAPPLHGLAEALDPGALCRSTYPDSLRPGADLVVERSG